ncbi:hypothetical protein L873DRAFT_1809597 [Choiromyces venosus 120613-1]|uniref:Uncharacterized protein n=1 Tax=Choiromyces venosus 120613-1 TaxID=1336337 RepID=A0A3N4JLB5_9PEZI|nr:hypothetical protein L873DRAFT_1809597 [Choiromyces venosus 120613-1]
MHYTGNEPGLSFGSVVSVFGRVANGWISGGRVEIAEAGEVGEGVEIGEVIPLKAYSAGVGNTPTSTTTTTATAVGILVCIKSQTPRTTTRTTTTGPPPTPSLRIQILDATSEASLTLWGPSATAAQSACWTPFNTALYITSAKVNMFNGSVQISPTQSSTLHALPLSAPVGAGLRRHVLRAYPHTRLQLPTMAWPPPAAGVGLLFTLAEFSAHAASRARSRKRIAGVGVVWGYLSVVLTGVEIVLLWKRNILFLGDCGGECVYTSTPDTHVCACAGNSEGVCGCAWSPNPSILTSLTDETATIPGTALIFSAKAWNSLLTPHISSKSAQELAQLETQLSYARCTLSVVWDSAIGVLYVCDVSP